MDRLTTTSRAPTTRASRRRARSPLPHPVVLPALVRLHPHERPPDQGPGQLVAGERRDQGRHPRPPPGLGDPLADGLGYVGLAVAPDSPWRRDRIDLLRDRSGPDLDEFALWLNLEDVYWSEKGRASIDAVVIAATLLTVALWASSSGSTRYEAVADLLRGRRRRALGQREPALVVPLQAIGLALAVVCFFKGKKFAGILGLFMPAVALIGAVRLAKPGSRWARRSRTASWSARGPGSPRRARPPARSRAESPRCRAPSRACSGSQCRGRTARPTRGRAPASAP